MQRNETQNNASLLKVQKHQRDGYKLNWSKCVYSLQIQPPLIRSRYYVRNAKIYVVFLRVSHVVAGANERSELYSQANVCNV